MDESEKNLDLGVNRTLPTAGLIVIRDNKLLLAYSKNKKAWYLPGGKIDSGENSLGALQREIQEELNITLNPKLLKLYCHITAPAYGEQPHIIMEQDCFIYELKENIQPGKEIEEVKFFDMQAYQLESAQVSGVLQVFHQLRKDKIII
ncbi:NUDIX domain-containing protein [Elizabethkingia argentiflava]|uniref:NUDIX domain-containing protein n=1 Tax=Elizabethkingia argenteiflava TaxID=2681556 RepID=A0A845PYV9_9FLAO|nr:NUDIX domain-containing protein [Elizabethkingia argenteiflava]NAW51548.1 NUDIX domain-containing protein [Elizabethkingia argenteiflava]